jgi:transcription antitermination factor NusG
MQAKNHRKVYMGDKVLVISGEFAGATGLVCGIDRQARVFSFFATTIGRVIRANEADLQILN